MHAIQLCVTLPEIHRVCDLSRQQPSLVVNLDHWNYLDIVSSFVELSVNIVTWYKTETL